MPSRHLIMVTLRGGAQRHEFRADDGSRFAGSDNVGSVSFLPADCGRDLMLTDVAWEWGAIALDPHCAHPKMRELGPFAAAGDLFLHGLVAQMHMLLGRDGTLDASYCSAMSLAVAQYLLRRGQLAPDTSLQVPHRLTARQMRLTLEQIDANLAMPLRIAKLAGTLQMSEGHFYRAFKGTTGRSPLTVISDRRVERAAGLLIDTSKSITEIAFDVGLGSPSHLARLFRERKGHSPMVHRQLFRDRSTFG